MKTWILVLSLFANGAWASSIEFKARCVISEPTTKIILDNDPREIIQCHENKGEIHLGFNRPLKITIGNQEYFAETDWKSIDKKCAEALKSYEKYPEIFLVDPETDAYMLANFSTDLSKVTISMRLNRDSCFGKRAN